MKFVKKNNFIITFFYLFSLSINAQTNWQAKWIIDPTSQNESNTWYCFRKDFKLDSVPANAIAKIAVDTKYWLWVNGQMVVFEGGLKRGPNPKDTYYDEVDLTPYLKKGNNNVSLLNWYFGKDGYSHISSGKAGLIFECITPVFKLLSDKTWNVKQDHAYETCPAPYANFRLSESSLRFDANQSLGNWWENSFDAKRWSKASEVGNVPMAPWNNLVLRPIPMWKNSGLKEYTNKLTFPIQTEKDTVIVGVLPSNLQVTPYLQIEAPSGLVIDMRTEDFRGGGNPNVYAQYVTRKGIQEYESFGWINGHKMIYSIPKGVKVLGLKYRETGYDTEFAGSFTSSDDFLNRLWQKSLRTLYLNMRDNYMDCPDRERAQWWGDEVTEGGEAFYALCPKSHRLFRKGMYELIGWQRPDSTLFSPIPSGNCNAELPCQMLTSIGYYGFWNYYLNTGDKQTIADLYDGVRKYMKVWKINERGTVVFRPGEWTWGDWGTDRDLELIYNGLFYMALKGSANMADLLGKTNDAIEYRQTMVKLKTAYNEYFWNGAAYRDPKYKGKTDDRSQALAVVSGLADKDKYPALFEVFKNEEHASPYMEKYVLEALFQMGYEEYAIQRMKKRFGEMIDNKEYATLFEGWGIGKNGFGGGTTNHAWSGGGLTILSQYLCGIAPIEPGYKVFQIVPQPASVKQASAKVMSVAGEIKSSFVNEADKFELTVSVPQGTTAIIGIPTNGFQTITANNKIVWNNGKYMQIKNIEKYIDTMTSHVKFEVTAGNWTFVATKYIKSIEN